VYALRKGGRDLIMMTDPHQPIPASLSNAQVGLGRIVALYDLLIHFTPDPTNRFGACFSEATMRPNPKTSRLTVESSSTGHPVWLVTGWERRTT
jgi:hypothetical protein